MSTIHVIIPPEAAGQNLALWLAREGYPFAAPCGGRGVCGKCRVTVTKGFFLSQKDGSVLAPDASGQVLACQSLCSGEGTEIEFETKEGKGLTLSEEDAAADSTESERNGQDLAVALDIGTTTLAAALVDRSDGRIRTTASALNPQQAFGADVISRIQAAKDGHLPELQKSVLQGVGTLLAELRAPEGCSMTVAGNTTMLHLFAGISPEGLGAYPFTPVFTGPKELNGADLGLPLGPITLLPSATGFFGADAVCGILISEMTRSERPVLFLDIGTNGEMALYTGKTDRLLVASSAAGPALEGATVSCGMGGVSGAVCHVTAMQEDLVYSTIGDEPPKGLCGSGLIDLAAVLLKKEELDESGCLEDEDYRLSGSQKKEGKLLPPSDTSVLLTQQDVRELQLAKSAIRAGLQALLAEGGIREEEVSALVLAGGLGHYLSPASAAAIGLIPPSLEEKVVSLGNTALAGAVRCLGSPETVRELQTLAERCSEIELNRSEVFNEGFIEYMIFGE